ncbi:MAG: hypothetical protein AAGF12_15775 [Myxococcota bacterium]
MNRPFKGSPRILIAAILWLAFSGSLALGAFVDGWWLGVAGVFGVAYLAMFRASRRGILGVALGLALSPWCFASVAALTTHAVGQPVWIRAEGGARIIDPVTRTVQVQRLGPLATGQPVAVFHNELARELSRRFGIAPHAFDGPYPEEEAARRLLNQEGTIASLGDLRSTQRIWVGSRHRVFVLPWSLVRRVMAQSRDTIPYSSLRWSWSPDVRVALLEERTLVLGIPDRTDGSSGYRTILLIDIESRVPFAIYGAGPPLPVPMNRPSTLF